jgi:hypothetical protein
MRGKSKHLGPLPTLYLGNVLLNLDAEREELLGIYLAP